MKKVLISGMIGNGFEWYDFALYGQMAVILGTLFFPNTDPMLSLLATYSAFAVGFVFRPLGALLFGWIGDKYGRKKALVAAILMMAIPTGAIGILPTYEQIGIAAPILLVIIRIFQGLSLGGEFGGAITYTVEHAPSDKRGFIGSFTMTSLVLGFVSGSLVSIVTQQLLGADAFVEYGWRIPFLLGIAIGLVGFYIRSKCDESPIYEVAKEMGHISAQPVRDVFKHHRGRMLRAFAAYTAVTMPFYLIAIFFIGYFEKFLGLLREQALTINITAMLVMLVGMVIGAVLSDQHGRRIVMMTILLVMLVAVIPLMSWMQSGNYTDIWLASCCLAFILGIYLGPIPAFLVEVFPTSIRYTGMSLAFNGATVVFGGTAPWVCTWLLKETGTHLSIALYVMFCCVFALAALWGYRDRWKDSIA